jgi:hypothetical protein
MLDRFEGFDASYIVSAPHPSPAASYPNPFLFIHPNASQVRFVMRLPDGSSAINASSPASIAHLQSSPSLVSDAHGRAAAQPQVVEREGEFGFEWLVSWKPLRLGLQRVQLVCFAASVSAGVRDASQQLVLSMSLPHCITFVLVPDPPPTWSAAAMALLPLRIVMGTRITLQLQASDDNPDDSIQLHSLTPPADLPSFVKIDPGAPMRLHRDASVATSNAAHLESQNSFIKQR